MCTFSRAPRSLKDAFLLEAISILCLALNSAQKWLKRASSKSRPPRLRSQAWLFTTRPVFLRDTTDTCVHHKVVEAAEWLQSMQVHLCDFAKKKAHTLVARAGSGRATLFHSISCSVVHQNHQCLSAICHAQQIFVTKVQGSGAAKLRNKCAQDRKIIIILHLILWEREGALSEANGQPVLEIRAS